MQKKKNTFEEKLKKDARWYESDEYKNLSEKAKLRHFKNTAKMIYDHVIKNGLHVNKNGQLLEFKLQRNRNRHFDVCARDLGLYNDGCLEYGNGKEPFVMNKRQLHNGKLIREIMFHESIHLLQEELKQLRNRYQPGQPEYNYLLTLESNISTLPKEKEYELFGFKISGQCYVNPQRCNDRFADTIKNALYKMMCVERYAYQTTLKYKDIICGDEIPQNNFQSSITTIQKRYNCEHLSNNEILDLLDSAQRSIYTQSIPSSKLESMIMYDIAASLAYQNGHIEPQEYILAMKEESMMNALAQYGYEHEDLDFEIFNLNDITDHADVFKALDRNGLQHLSIGERINNPSLMMHIVYYYGEEGSKLIPDKKMLLDWCRSDKNNLNEDIWEDAAQILGDEFSPEECKKYKEKQQKIENMLECKMECSYEDHKIKKSRYVEEYDFDYDPHDTTRDEYGFERD